MAPPKKEPKALISARETSFLCILPAVMISYILLKWSERVLWKESEWKRSIGHTQIWIGVMWVRGFKEGVRKPVVGSTFAFRQNVLSLLPRGFMR